MPSGEAVPVIAGNLSGVMRHALPGMPPWRLSRLLKPLYFD
jgi:hypothetical protein